MTPLSVRRHAVIYGVILVALISMSPRRTIGDAGEYLAYAVAMSLGRSPALSEETVAAVRGELAVIDPSLAGWDLEATGHRAGDGRLEFVHFWLYPALAAPFVWLSGVAGLDPRTGFAILNVGLLTVAFAVVLGRLPRACAWLLFAGPIVWWADKIHPEALIFAALAIAFALTPSRPVPGIAAAGLAASQVPPIAAFVPLLAGAVLVTRRLDARGGAPGPASGWHDVAIGTALGAGLAALPALYYLWRFGTPTLLVSAAQMRWPTSTELGVVLWDLNLGLVPNWPWFGVAVASALVAIAAGRPARLLPAATGAVVGGTILLFAFTQIGNVMHGATPGLIRYAIWLPPIAIPVFVAAALHRPWRLLVVAIALVSVPLSLVRYRPSVGEFAHRPTAVAEWVWRHRPAWSHPLPEVFVKSLGQTVLPAYAPGCGKLLLVGRGDHQGMWPRACAPAPVSDACRTPAVRCYADRHGREYRFVRAPEDAAHFPYGRDTVWPRTGEAGVLGAMQFVDWWTLRPAGAAGDEARLRVEGGAAVESVRTGDGRLFAVIVADGTDGALVFAPSGEWRGMLVDAGTGQTVASQAGGPGAEWRIVLPVGPRILVLAVTRAST